MVFPMLQHSGAECVPLVSSGDFVKSGQKIGDSDGPVSSPIHSSVSGTVRDVGPALTPNGITVGAVTVENDGNYTDCEPICPKKSRTDLPKNELLGIIREAGIVGLGGAGFPAHVKLGTDRDIDYMIVNGAECEPFLTSDLRILLEESEKVIRGLRIILSMFPNAKGIVAVESDKPHAVGKMREQCEMDGQEHPHSPIEVVKLRTKYPQGSEKQLIRACTGREVPSGKLPADIGCVVSNTATVAAVERAVRLGRPLLSRVVTVAGDAVTNPGNYKVRLGMSHRSLIEAAGGYCLPPRKLISGGPMMGTAMFTDEVPVIKTTSGFVCLSGEKASVPAETACIRCGKCVAHCPMGLMPLELNKYAVRREKGAFAEYNGNECIGCGCCSYVCPAKRYLAQSIYGLKKEKS